MIMIKIVRNSMLGFCVDYILILIILNPIHLSRAMHADFLQKEYLEEWKEKEKEKKEITFNSLNVFQDKIYITKSKSNSKSALV